MHSPKVHAQLDRLGLGSLLDQPLPLTRGNGRLHLLPRCSSLFARPIDLGLPHGTLPLVPTESVTLTVRQVSEPVCGCLKVAGHPPLGPLTQAVILVQTHLELHPGDAPPVSTSHRTLQRLAARVNRLDDLVEHLSDLRALAIDPAVVSARDHLVAEVATELEGCLERLRSSGLPALVLSEAARWSAFGPGARRLVLGRLRRAVGSHGDVVALRWVELVEAGFDAPGRRRRIARYVGGFLHRTSPLPPSVDEVRAVVKEVASALEGAERRLSARLAEPDPQVVMSTHRPPRLDDGGYHRLVLEVCTASRSGADRLLVGPRRVLQQYLGSTANVEDPSRIPMVLMPEDPALAENVVHLWDPRSESQLSTPAGAVEAAGLV